MFLTGHRTSRE